MEINLDFVVNTCETAINDVIYEWKEAQDSSKIIFAVFLDFPVLLILAYQFKSEINMAQSQVRCSLFYIINDSNHCLTCSRIKMFVDHTLIHVAADDIEEALLNINHDLSILFDKLFNSKLKLNVRKTIVMVI